MATRKPGLDGQDSARRAGVEASRVEWLQLVGNKHLANISSTHTVLSQLPQLLPFFQDDDLKELLERVKRLIQNPKELVTGPQSTGNRGDTTKRWREHCESEGRTLETHCPLKRARMTFDVWAWSQWTCDISALLTITWSYDCCNVYDADATLTIQRNDCSQAGAFLIEHFSIPETDPVDPRPCRPCTPKCLRARLSIIFYDAAMANLPGIHKKIDLDLLLCPSSDGTPKVDESATDYTQLRGDGDGATPGKEQQPGTETWGIKKKAGPTNY